jgi:GTP-binding protein HflX
VEIGAGNKEVILVMNKSDAFFNNDEQKQVTNPDELKNTWMSKMNQPVVFISALKKTNLNTLREMIYQRVSQFYAQRYPENKQPV